MRDCLVVAVGTPHGIEQMALTRPHEATDLPLDRRSFRLGLVVRPAAHPCR